MYNVFLNAHSGLRYLVLIALVVVIVSSFIGIINKKPFGKWDNKLSLYLFIFTHLQLLAGLILYFISPFVKFGPDTMKNSDFRYWTVEHIIVMLIAIVLITIARISTKKMTTDLAKHKRLFTFNLIAFIMIIGILLSKGILLTRYLK